MLCCQVSLVRERLCLFCVYLCVYVCVSWACVCVALVQHSAVSCKNAVRFDSCSPITIVFPVSAAAMCVALTLALSLPALWRVCSAPTRDAADLLSGIVYMQLCSFTFGWHVHEKGACYVRRM